MKAILACVAVFTAMFLLFSCSGEKSFENSEDFESGKFIDTLFGPGTLGTSVWVVSDRERVISGQFSVYSKVEPYRGKWWEFLTSEKKKLRLERKGFYRVTFKYKAIETPSADGFFYFALKTPKGGHANNLAFTKWSDGAGTAGTKTVTFRLGDFDDYLLIWGIHNQGALAIDDIRVTKSK